LINSLSLKSSFFILLPFPLSMLSFPDIQPFEEGTVEKRFVLFNAVWFFSICFKSGQMFLMSANNTSTASCYINAPKIEGCLVILNMEMWIMGNKQKEKSVLGFWLYREYEEMLLQVVCWDISTILWGMLSHHLHLRPLSPGYIFCLAENGQIQWERKLSATKIMGERMDLTWRHITVSLNRRSADQQTSFVPLSDPQKN